MRIFAASDSHGNLDWTVPECDLFLHAGDVCPDFAPGMTRAKQEEWLNSKWVEWVRRQPAGTLAATFGNHDFVNNIGTPDHFHVNTEVTGPFEHQGLKIWFSPWSNRFGGWAWMASPEYFLKEYYEAIPADIDILVSHGPAYGYGDKVAEKWLSMVEDPHVGSKELLAAIERIRPKVVICGHIHAGFGEYRYNDTRIYNVALVNEEYQLVNQPTEIVLE
jgi:Icc-related predicted phosphoesterase